MADILWHLRYIRQLIYVALAAAITGIFVAALQDAADWPQVWVTARQLYGLWALGLLLAAMIIGPLVFVLPWLPLKAHLVLGRRAVGVSAFLLAVVHAFSYLAPTLRRNWLDLFAPGKLWTAGLGIGLPVFLVMGVLAYTSRDQAVTRLGPRRWKRWHRAVYVLLPVALLHAVFVGADFGVNRGLDVKSDPDMGALIGMSCVAAGWLLLFLLRRRRAQWTPAFPGKRKS